ncbi:SusE domain-containing protein [Flavobacterium sp. 3HN19-14]|uniref:SusE domain-containing protein n=1 Tax=Flavobacterium sp. 3HN19-14 TaxID=3448133 RepID=UPI003EDE89DD
MKRYIQKLTIIGALSFIGVSCENDADVTTLAQVNFTSEVVASPSTIVLNAENKYEAVTTISWPAVQYTVDAPVTYALQFDVASDTIGTTAWANAKRIEVGEDVLSKSFLGADLNELAKDFGIQPDTAGELVVRVVSYLDRAAYSDAIVLTVTPFTEVITIAQIYMPGSYQGWNPATAATLTAIDNGVFQGYVTFPVGQGLGFKFTTEPDWDEFYGLDTNGNFAEHGDTDLTVPAYGSYQITVNLNTLSFTAVPYSWGIIGTSTAGGWNSDTDMTYDYVNKVWKFVGPLVPGALKYRLNDSWTVNYGQNSNSDPVVYFDNQGAYTISVAGNYTVTFALNPDPATANYTVTLN